MDTMAYEQTRRHLGKSTVLCDNNKLIAEQYGALFTQQLECASSRRDFADGVLVTARKGQ